MIKNKLTHINLFAHAKMLSISVVLSSVVTSAVSVGIRQYCGDLIDALSADQVRNFNWIFLIGMTILYALLRFIQPYTQKRLANRLQLNLYAALEDKALNANQSELDGINPGKASTYFTSDVAGIIRYANRITAFGIPDLFTFLFSLAALAIMNLWVGLAAVLSAVFPALLMFFMSRSVVNANVKYQGVVQQINQKVSDYFYNLEFIKANGMESNLEGENVSLVDDLLKKKKALARHEAILSFPTMLSSFLTILIISVTGGYFVLQGSISVGQLFSAITLADYIVSPVMRFQNTISQIRRAEANFYRINNFLTISSEEETAGHVRAKTDDAVSSIAIRDLRFQYPNGSQVFSGSDFEWEKGQLNVIVGENGAGKSTLIKLISGVYTPQAGYVELKGINLPEHLTKNHLRKKIVIDTQRTVLFPDTIRANLTMGRDIRLDQIKATSMAVGIDAEIQA